jgi:hypothetical protein
MSRTHRALAMLTLSLALFGATTAAAVAATPPTGVEDQNDRRLRSLQAARAERTLAAVERNRSMERHFNATTTGTSPAAIEDRLLRSLKAEQAERTLAAVALARSMEHNLAPVPVAAAAAAAPAPPAVRPDQATPGAEVLATLLLGLAGGLVGGGVVIGGWIIGNRRRTHRAAATA